MKTLVDKLGLSGNPFEHYTAETEPNITEYAVRPPYLQAISDRVQGLSSFILFGDRGAGKSATRITVFNDAWSQVSPDVTDQKGQRPFVVNLTDFASVLDLFKKDKLGEREVVGLVAFTVLEQVMAWLSSLESELRDELVARLDKDDRTLMLAMLQAFYLNRAELDREVSTGETLRLLNTAWVTKSSIWANKRWDALSKVFGTVVSALTKKHVADGVDIAEPAEALVRSLVSDSPNAPRAIMARLVQVVKSFGFSGIAVLIDKVDETPATSSSAEATSRLIYPLLAHVQLLEVEGFAWVPFLWSNVKAHFNGKHAIRLDKIANATITWNAISLREMVEARIRFYSNDSLNFADLLSNELDADETFKLLTEISVSSPREMIRLLDTIVREHDALGRGEVKISEDSLRVGLDKFALETVEAWFPANPLQQVFRMGKTSFVNRDVQACFKISDQGARVKIKGWEDAGLVRQSGTSPSEMGGKPVYLYAIADARVKRIIEGTLLPVVGADGDGDAEDGEIAVH